MRQLNDNGQEHPEAAKGRPRQAVGAWLHAQGTATGFLMFLVLVSVVLIGAGLR